MRLRILFVDYSTPDLDTVPNAMAVSDDHIEQVLGEIPGHYAEALPQPGWMYPTREAFVTIPDEWVRGLFQNQTTEGKPQ